MEICFGLFQNATEKGFFLLSENSAFSLCLCLVISLTYEDQVYELKQLKQLFKVKQKAMNIYFEVLFHSIMKSKSPKLGSRQLTVFQLCQKSWHFVIWEKIKL